MAVVSDLARLDWTTSAILNTSTSFEFQSSDVSRALALRVGFGQSVAHGTRWECVVIM